MAQAKIYFPIEDKGLYEDLLCKQYNVFSKGKTDPFKANNFEHKIEKRKMILSM
jgi:hypothetical protein